MNTHNDQLKGYFAFDDGDLNSNRNGKLSERQNKRFKEVDQFANRFVLGLFLVFLTGGLFFGYRAVTEMTSIGLWVTTVILLLIAAWAFRGVLTSVDNSVEKVTGEVTFVKVEKLTGSPTDLSSNRMTVSSYEMRVGGEAFGNANPVLIEMMQDDVYTVYYTKTTRQILSVEFVSKGK